jgi:nucleoid DNA-binding protein
VHPPIWFVSLRDDVPTAPLKRAGSALRAARLERLSPLAASSGYRNQLSLNRMTKQQLIEKVAAKTEVGKTQVEVAVDSILELIAETLRSNERVDLRGFGSFVVKERKERQGRNPRTGATITIAAKRDASFRPGKELTEKLAQTMTAPKPEGAV